MARREFPGSGAVDDPAWNTFWLSAVSMPGIGRRISKEDCMLPFAMIGATEILIVGAVILLLFGNRLPGVMRSVGAASSSSRRGFGDRGRFRGNAFGDAG